MKKKLGSMLVVSATLGLAALAAGCAPEGDPTVGDESTVAPAALGAAVCLASQSGAYCGNDEMSNASAATLYQCPGGANKAPISGNVCPNGCIVAPPGSPDACASGPVCLGGAGAYCGGDEMKNADPAKLYQCPGVGLAPTSSTACANGCVIAPPGTPDSCQTVTGVGSPSSYRLPWSPGINMSLAQDCNDSCCNDHVGYSKYAWDFSNYTNFDIRAARAGTVTHVKIDSNSGCASSSCAGDANYIVIDHGDGTESLYLHLKQYSLDPAVTCGAHVDQGQRLASAGTTGWSSGTHLHFQVNSVNATAPQCECGSTGLTCSSTYVPWQDFWSVSTHPTVPVTFDEWPASSACANRRIELPPSQN